MHTAAAAAHSNEPARRNAPWHVTLAPMDSCARFAVVLAWCLCLLLTAQLAVSVDVEPDDLDYLELQSAGRQLAEQPADGAGSPCSGKPMGTPVPGQYVLMFDQQKVNSVDEGVKSLARAFSAASEVSAASAGPPPFAIVKEFAGGSVVATGGRRRRLLQADVQLPLGIVIKTDSATAEFARGVDSVQYVENDVCIKALVSDAAALPGQTFSCLPAPQLSGITLDPEPTASWPGCLAPGNKLAWWGERCGGSNNQVQWSGVYAYNAATGARVANCVKTRPSTGSVSDDTRYWLGSGCAETPAAVPDMPRFVCNDPFKYVPPVCASSSDICPSQPCIPYESSNVQQTLQILHPTPGCGGASRQMRMTFTGERCYGAAPSGSITAGIRWLSAAPADPADNGAACTITRASGGSASDQIFNKNYLGSCGVPPARVQYLAWAECARPPPPPPPPPPSPPPPRQRTQLPRVPVQQGGQTVPPGIRRVMAVASRSGSEDGELLTVEQVFPSSAAVLDSGVDCAQPDLNVAFTRSFVTERSPDPTRDPGCFDGLGHGTHVSGIIGAKNNKYGVIGILPGTPIVGLKVLDATGNGEFSDFMEALLWLLLPSLNGTEDNPGNATNAERLSINVINLSLGWPARNISSNTNANTLCNMLQTLTDIGMVVVAAASNDAQPLNVMVPAMCPAVVAATSINQRNGAIDTSQEPSSFSNYLDLVNRPNQNPPTPEKQNRTIAAPGDDINSTCSAWRTANINGYCVFSGTSQATPHIAGMFVRCFSSGACRDTRGAENVPVGIEEWAYYNNYTNREYGYSKDPIRDPTTTRYYGFLSWADAW